MTTVSTLTPADSVSVSPLNHQKQARHQPIQHLQQALSKGRTELKQYPLLQAGLHTIGTAIAAATIGSTLCAPLKTINLSIVSGRPIQMNRIITSLAPPQLAPHFKAILMNNLSLLLPHLLAREGIEHIPSLRQLTPFQKASLTNLAATSFCTASFLNQGVETVNRLATGTAVGIAELTAKRGNAVVMAATAAFMTREACGLIGLTAPDNKTLVRSAIALATAADFTFATRAITTQSQQPSPAQTLTFFLLRAIDTTVFVQTTQKVTNKVGQELNQLMPPQSA